MAKPPTFNRDTSKILGFITVYKLYIRMRMRDTSVEKQVQWVLSYIRKIGRHIKRGCDKGLE